MPRVRPKNKTRPLLLVAVLATAAGMLLLYALVSSYAQPRPVTGAAKHSGSSTATATGLTIAASAAPPMPAGISTWVPSIPPNPKTLHVPILMYHYVDVRPPVPGPWGRKLTLPTAKFKAQMNYLATHGYHTVTLQQLYAAMAGLALLPSKPVALTFDDSGQDNYTVAFPILRSHHFVATFFVITGVVGKPGCMTWRELKEMSSYGMAIESHTVHHHFLRSLSDTMLHAELAGSREAIRAHLGVDARFLSYPDGGCDTRVMKATQAAGYLAAVTDKPGTVGDTLYPTAAYNWPRQGIGPRETLAMFEKALTGAPLPSSPGRSLRLHAAGLG